MGLGLRFRGGSIAKRTTLLIVGVVAAAAVLAPLSQASTQERGSKGSVRYTGETSQGRSVVLLANRKGIARQITFHFRIDCDPRGKIPDGRQRFVMPFDSANANGFRDGGTYRHDLKGNGHARIRTSVRGKRSDAEHMSGTFRFFGKYFVRGELVSTCQKKVGWKAERK